MKQIPNEGCGSCKHRHDRNEINMKNKCNFRKDYDLCCDYETKYPVNNYEDELLEALIKAKKLYDEIGNIIADYNTEIGPKIPMDFLNLMESIEIKLLIEKIKGKSWEEINDN